jgi:hypothetical protein
VETAGVPDTRERASVSLLRITNRLKARAAIVFMLFTGGRPLSVHVDDRRSLQFTPASGSTAGSREQAIRG